MNRYLSKTESSKESKDLLTLIKKSFNEKSPVDEWKSYESRNVNAIDITCDIQEKHLKTKNYVGWKTDENGDRMYATFRSGQRVNAQGQEAFKLAYGDGNIKKRKAQEIVEIDQINDSHESAQISSKKQSKKSTKKAEGATIASFFTKKL